MTPGLFQRTERDGAVIDLSARAKWRVSGQDRVRYLNGQVTNDARRASESGAIYACVTNAKGRIEGDLFLRAAPGDALLLDAEPGLREALLARLEKYVVADDVVIEDVTEDWKLIHAFGSAAEPEAWGAGRTGDARMVRANRFGEDGCDLWIPVSCPLPPAPCPMLSADDAEIWRICRGLPRWPHELNGDAFPQEAGLESRAMDFAKGCYIGQEVLSRIKTTGRMPRKLVRFTLEDPAFRLQAPESREAAWRLWFRSANGLKEAGAVTSACRHPVLDRVVGLGYVRQDLEREHALLLAPEDPPGILFKVEISEQ
jgi:tRNA-modifying protein YgfZ